MDEPQRAPRPYFRTPAIAPDGSRVAFVYAADIWLVASDGGEAERLTAHPAGHFAPRWSSDGSQIAFASSRTGAGDIYVLPLRGGEVRRVTFHESASRPEAWSHDDTHIYFSSRRGGQGTALYRIPVAGGTPTPWVAQPYEQLGNLSIAPGGERLAFNVLRDAWWRRGPNPYGGADIWVGANVPGAEDLRRLSAPPGLSAWPLWAPDGQGLYFVSDRDGIENLWYQALDGGDARQVTRFAEGRLLWPSISADGRTIVFERDFGIWRLDTATGACEPLAIRVRHDTKITPVRVATYSRDLSELALAPDGKKVAFVVRGEVFADFADKETDKEQRQGASFRVTSTAAREHDIAWSPDSHKLVYVSDRHGDEEVYSYNFATRAETRHTSLPGRRKGMPRPSPDGAWIAYVCGDDEVRLISVETGEDRPFARAPLPFGADIAWSPDSRWLLFTAQDANAFVNLYVQAIGSDTPRQITFLSNLESFGPIWAPNGQFVVFTTRQYRAESQIARVDLRPPAPFFREAEFEKLFEPRPAADDRRQPADAAPEKKAGGQARTSAEEQENAAAEREPAPDAPPGERDEPPAAKEESRPQAPGAKPQAPQIEIVFEGIERRLRFLTPKEMDAYAQCVSPDSRDLVFRARVAGKSNLWTLPLDEPRADQSPRQLTASGGGKWAAQFAPDGKSLFFLDGGQIVSRKFPSGDQTHLPVSAEVVVDFTQEKLQIFDECWRLLRDQFYDPTFRGLDWSAAREQFAPLAAGAQTAGELHTIINLMVGELRASHLGISGAGGGYGQDGHTGLLFDAAEQARSGRLRVAAIVPESPAARAAGGAGIAVGEYLLAVDGVPVEPSTNLDRLLQRTVGRRVRLLLGPDPLGAGSHEVAVRPVAAEAYDQLCYRGWVHANEALVHRLSGERLGYVHIREMSYEAYQQFLVDLDTEAHGKEGVVIDVRFNGGGHIATFILDVLMRRSVLRTAFRDMPATDAGHLAGNRVLNKPTVLVTNEHSFSNTEMFAEAYRRLGLGKVVGRPTGGGVIWTWRYKLLDGSLISLPRMRVATADGEDLEGTGRAVDVDVALPLGEPARGEDSQLAAAVRTLLAQIDAGAASA